MTQPSSKYRLAVSCAVGLLITVGVVSSLLRYLVSPALHVAITTPLFGSYATDQLSVLSAHPVIEGTHRLGGVLYLLLGATQFMPRLRARAPQLHRWGGRLFLGLSVVAAVSGSIIAFAFPFDRGERAPTVLFGGLMVYFAFQAYARIRERNVQAHREWVIRCFSVGLGIGTIRVMAVGLLQLTSLTTPQVYVPVFWSGWALTLLLGEVWVRHTRPTRQPASVMTPASPAPS